MPMSSNLWAIFIRNDLKMPKLTSIFRPDSRFRAFFVSIATFAFAYGLYKGVMDNYLAEVVGMGEFDKGLSEFFRELPGFLLVFVLAGLYFFSAENIYKIGAVIMLAGMTMQSLVPATRFMVTLAIFVYSLGEHIQLGMRNTLSLQYSQEGRGGLALGIQNSVYQVGTLLGFFAVIAVFLIFGKSSSLFRPICAASAAIIALGAVFSTQMNAKSSTDKSKRRFYFRKKFSKYYMLEVFYGARKQIFFTFGP